MPKIKQRFLYLTVMTAAIFWGSFHAAQAGYEYHLEAKSPEMDQFESEIATKLNRGLVNVIFGWTEILRTPVDMAAGPKTGALKAAVTGIPVGLFRALGRTIVGVYEVATCYAPQKPIMRPIEGDVF